MHQSPRFTISPLLRTAALCAAAIGALPGLAAAGGAGEDEGTALVIAPAGQGAVNSFVPRNRLQFEAGVGVSAAPGYFGSDEIVVGPTGTFRLEGLTLGGRTLVDPNADPYGFGLTGSFRYIGERTAEEFPELAGLADIDAALEVGLGVAWTQPGYEVYADLRYGVVGHESFVGEVGADIYLVASDRLTFSAGPRLFFGDDDYAATYFGVTAGEAALSSFDAFEAGGGMLSGAIELGAAYDITDTWGVEGTVRYDRFLGDAADSPIVLGGSDDALSAGLVVTRNFSLDF